MSNIITADTDELDDADLGINVDPKEYHAQKAKQLTLVSKLKNALNSIKTALNTESKKYIKDLERRSNELIKLNDDIFGFDEEGSEEYINYKLSKKKSIRDIQLYRAFYAAIFSGFGHKYDDKINIMFDKVYNKIMPILSKNKIILYRGLCIPIAGYINVGEELKYFKYNLMDRNSWTTDINQAKNYATSGDKFPYHNVLLSVLLKIEASVDDVNLPMTFFEQGKDYFLDTEEINLRKSFQIKNISIIEMNYINNEYSEGDVEDNEPKKKVQDDDDDEDEVNSSALNNKTYLYCGNVITASSKQEAIHKIIAGLIWGVEGIEKLPKFGDVLFYVVNGTRYGVKPSRGNKHDIDWYYKQLKTGMEGDKGYSSGLTQYLNAWVRKKELQIVFKGKA